MLYVMSLEYEISIFIFLLHEHFVILISIYTKKKDLNYLWLLWMVLMNNYRKWFATRASFEFYLTFMNCFQFSCDFSIQNCFDMFSQIISLSYGLTTRVTFKIFVTFENTFYVADTMRRHLKTIHKDQKDFICRSCWKSFTRASYLRFIKSTKIPNVTLVENHLLFCQI